MIVGPAAALVSSYFLYAIDETVKRIYATEKYARDSENRQTGEKQSESERTKDHSCCNAAAIHRHAEKLPLMYKGMRRNAARIVETLYG